MKRLLTWLAVAVAAAAITVAASAAASAQNGGHEPGGGSSGKQWCLDQGGLWIQFADGTGFCDQVAP